MIECTKEKDKIKALIEAVRALKDEGYQVDHGDHFVDTMAISETGNQFRVRTLRFSLCKRLPLQGEAEEFRELIQALS